MNADLHRAVEKLVAQRRWPQPTGRVQRTAGLVVEATVANAHVGDILSIARPGRPLLSEVVGIDRGIARAIPLGPIHDVMAGAAVELRRDLSTFPVGDALRGRVVDGFGAPLDGLPAPQCSHPASLDCTPPAMPLRASVTEPFETGIRVIDGLLTCGRGQRIGIFAGAGVGKSVLVEQIARFSNADVVVVGLVGERGREVEQLARSEHGSKMVMVAATSDKSPMERIRGARAATAVAEYFRDQGQSVLLIIDSITRYAMALREIGLALGEPAATKGYTPTVFAELPRLLERVAPLRSGGSITAFYTVLVEGDHMSDPIADAARSLLDGHIILDRNLAARGQFPAVDILHSASRVFQAVADEAQQELAIRARVALDSRRTLEDLVSLGAYTPGTNPDNDRALALGRQVEAWARQRHLEVSTHSQAITDLAQALEEDSQ